MSLLSQTIDLRVEVGQPHLTTSGQLTLTAAATGSAGASGSAPSPQFVLFLSPFHQVVDVSVAPSPTTASATTTTTTTTMFRAESDERGSAGLSSIVRPLSHHQVQFPPPLVPHEDSEDADTGRESEEATGEEEEDGREGGDGDVDERNGDGGLVLVFDDDDEDEDEDENKKDEEKATTVGQHTDKTGHPRPASPATTVREEKRTPADAASATAMPPPPPPRATDMATGVVSRTRLKLSVGIKKEEEPQDEARRAPSRSSPCPRALHSLRPFLIDPTPLLEATPPEATTLTYTIAFAPTTSPLGNRDGGSASGLAVAPLRDVTISSSPPPSSDYVSGGPSLSPRYALLAVPPPTTRHRPEGPWISAGRAAAGLLCPLVFPCRDAGRGEAESVWVHPDAGVTPWEPSVTSLAAVDAASRDAKGASETCSVQLWCSLPCPLSYLCAAVLWGGGEEGVALGTMSLLSTAPGAAGHGGGQGGDGGGGDPQPTQLAFPPYLPPANPGSGLRYFFLDCDATRWLAVLDTFLVKAAPKEWRRAPVAASAASVTPPTPASANVIVVNGTHRCLAWQRGVSVVGHRTMIVSVDLLSSAFSATADEDLCTAVRRTRASVALRAASLLLFPSRSSVSYQGSHACQASTMSSNGMVVEARSQAIQEALVDAAGGGGSFVHHPLAFSRFASEELRLVSFLLHSCSASSSSSTPLLQRDAGRGGRTVFSWEEQLLDELVHAYAYEAAGALVSLVGQGHTIPRSRRGESTLPTTVLLAPAYTGSTRAGIQAGDDGHHHHHRDSPFLTCGAFTRIIQDGYHLPAFVHELRRRLAESRLVPRIDMSVDRPTLLDVSLKWTALPPLLLPPTSPTHQSPLPCPVVGERLARAAVRGRGTTATVSLTLLVFACVPRGEESEHVSEKKPLKRGRGGGGAAGSGYRHRCRRRRFRIGSSSSSSSEGDGSGDGSSSDDSIHPEEEEGAEKMDGAFLGTDAGVGGRCSFRLCQISPILWQVPVRPLIQGRTQLTTLHVQNSLEVELSFLQDGGVLETLLRRTLEPWARERDTLWARQQQRECDGDEHGARKGRIAPVAADGVIGSGALPRGKARGKEKTEEEGCLAAAAATAGDDGKSEGQGGGERSGGEGEDSEEDGFMLELELVPKRGGQRSAQQLPEQPPPAPPRRSHKKKPPPPPDLFAAGGGGGATPGGLIYLPLLVVNEAASSPFVAPGHDAALDLFWRWEGNGGGDSSDSGGGVAHPSPHVWFLTACLGALLASLHRPTLWSELCDLQAAVARRRSASPWRQYTEKRGCNAFLLFLFSRTNGGGPREMGERPFLPPLELDDFYRGETLPALASLVCALVRDGLSAPTGAEPSENGRWQHRRGRTAARLAAAFTKGGRRGRGMKRSAAQNEEEAREGEEKEWQRRRDIVCAALASSTLVPATRQAERDMLRARAELAAVLATYTQDKAKAKTHEPVTAASRGSSNNAAARARGGEGQGDAGRGGLRLPPTMRADEVWPLLWALLASPSSSSPSATPITKEQLYRIFTQTEGTGPAAAAERATSSAPTRVANPLDPEEMRLFAYAAAQPPENPAVSSAVVKREVKADEGRREECEPDVAAPPPAVKPASRTLRLRR